MCLCVCVCCLWDSLDRVWWSECVCVCVCRLCVVVNRGIKCEVCVQQEALWGVCVGIVWLLVIEFNNSWVPNHLFVS